MTPLSGLRVVDASQGIAGPYCCLQLGDAGADVVKVEPYAGDMTRQWSPRTTEGESIPFTALNRGKRSAILDPVAADDRAAVEALVTTADVVVVDAPGTFVDAMPWEVARELNPGLVYCVVSGYGPAGPWKNRPGGELPAQLAAEFTSSLGAVGDHPVRLGTDAASMFAGIHAAQGICAALVSRDDSGRGDRVDVSLFGSLLTMRSTLWVALSRPDEWWGFHLDSYVKPPFRGYRCADGRIYFELRNLTNEQHEQLREDLHMEWARQDPLFTLLAQDTAGGTGRYSHVVLPLWEQAFAEFTTDQLITIIERHGGAAFPVNDYASVTSSAQVEHLEAIGKYDDANGKTIRYVTSPWPFGDGSQAFRSPLPGEHTDDVLASLRLPPETRPTTTQLPQTDD